MPSTAEGQVLPSAESAGTFLFRLNAYLLLKCCFIEELTRGLMEGWNLSSQVRFSSGSLGGQWIEVP